MLWKHLSWTSLRITLEAEQDCRLPAYKGSMLRGAMGHRLQEQACWWAGRERCSGHSSSGNCQRPHACAFGALWDSAPGFRGEPPKPYVIVPPIGEAGQRLEYSAGEQISWEILLVGEARPWAPWLLNSLQNCWHLGSDRSAWQTVLIEIEMRLGEFEPLPAGCSPDYWPVIEADQIQETSSYSPQAELNFLTPVDIKTKGRRDQPLTGYEFASRAVGRVVDLVASYCSDISAEEIQLARQLAVPVQLGDESLDREEWQRFSSTHGTHRLTGLSGQVILKNISPELWVYLQLGQFIHIGKGASFGQGRYLLHPLEKPDRDEFSSESFTPSLASYPE
ncbi:CRISPR system precrRNA processing endoribonuclease RAMP protein Cas6 [Rubinisphaera italica]|uniref:CRISPR-associated protein Cas6 C-terminal domain-containing protein n=1 Tax=Rubinisphaera italica TaxID=2527969 RepID=A0A5C5XMN2_9PLAN|nr:CRISPR system precrRNA processing endoribonuclease RAMP protein Cas6 [Rubinisphaera italica]TWT63731.1 hypothetical protein Pan54_44890 [Rubinisphaera italica]